MNKKLRGCLIVFASTVVVLVVALVIAGIRTVRANNRADDTAKALCAEIPIGSTIEVARAAARRHEAKKEHEYEGKHRFLFWGVLMHQAECVVEMRDGVVVKTSFQVDDY